MHTKHLVFWLFSCCSLVCAVVIIGAITRLTGAGLSITEWNVIMGALPPLSHDAWQQVFEKYQHSPQFRKENTWMQLGDFQFIFFWEWLHRLLARLVGLAYILPLAWFWLRKQIPPGYALKFLALVVLVGLQGVVGWYMVKSGLVDRPSVSHYRLAAHLSLAFLLYALTLWQALVLRGVSTHPDKPLCLHTLATLVFFIVTFIWGAFTAGLDAGLIYNETFPKMGGQWLPADLWHLQPAVLNFLENPPGVQFMHRWLAMITAVLIISLWVHARKKRAAGTSTHLLALMAFVQIGLGIATLLSGVAIPLAVLHQAGALVILTLLVMNARRYTLG